MSFFKTKAERKTIKCLKRERRKIKSKLSSLNDELEYMVIDYLREKKINENYSTIIDKSNFPALTINMNLKVSASDNKISNIRKKIVKQDKKITDYKKDIERINKIIYDIKKS